LIDARLRFSCRNTENFVSQSNRLPLSQNLLVLAKTRLTHFLFFFQVREFGLFGFAQDRLWGTHCSSIDLYEGDVAASGELIR
jgi:hypothetical protein